MATKKEIQVIVEAIQNNFRTFGGCKSAHGNPIAEALKNKPPVFAAGVDVEEVVRFILRKVKPKVKIKTEYVYTGRRNEII